MSEIGSRNHRQVVRIRRMEQRVEVGKAGSARCQRGKARVADGTLVVHIFEHDDQHAIEMARLGTRRARAASSCFPFGDFVICGCADWLEDACAAV